MPAAAKLRPLKALYVLARAWYATKPQTEQEADACRAQMIRTRDFLTHQPPAPFAVAGVSVTQQEDEALREPALVEMRARCQLCGLCAMFGRPPP